MKPESWIAQLRRRLAALLLVGLCSVALAGCGGGDNGGGSGSSTGEVYVGLTDADGDFLTYAVDVLSITMTRADGAVVEVLPNATRVDFAQYVELTEFISAATVPSGVYVSGKIRLDYSNADVQVEVGGVATPALIRDANGQPITTLELNVRLDDRKRLVIVPGVPAHLTFDFDLKMSNAVNLAAAPPVVTVSPFLLAEVNPETPKIHRVRGPLKSVNVATSSFELFIRPFYRLLGNHGALTVVTDANTAYEIDGTNFTGATGLTALAAKPLGTATIAVGDLDVAARRFVAREVYAGSSVPFGTSDAVTGNITARSGDTLTVRGATLVRADGTLIFRNDVTVLVGANTIVTKQAVAATGLDKDDLSVGQRVTVLGALDQVTMTMDATSGIARMLFTTLTGTVNSAVVGEVQMNLQTIDGRPISRFNFAGTGTPGNDADPVNYEVATGALSLSGITSGSPVRVRGFVRRFGQAPDDFDATTVINVAALPALLAVDWLPATAAPFTSSSSSAILLNLAGTGALHHVFRGGVVTDLSGTTPTIEPQTTGTSLFAIGYQGTVTVYSQFSLYEQALQTNLAQGRRVRALAAGGSYADAATTLTAKGAVTAFE